MRVLVAIANYGNANRQYLEKVLEAYRKMPINVTLVVLSDCSKNLGRDVEVKVGLPTSNPWSLPFAHRSLFRDKISGYDFFIYSEDDTLLSWENFSAFKDSLNILKHNEISGFLRKEEGADKNIYYSSCHSFFRWIPSSVRNRGNELWARYSNEHSACFIANQNQIRKAFESAGFVAEPHEGRFDMLCSAATDLYTQCGFEKLICLDRIKDFTLSHLPNKYIGIMGLPEQELNWQIEALKKIFYGKLSAEELLEPETLLPGCFGAKRLREEQDLIIEKMINGFGKRILVWGAGDGIFESILMKKGYFVSVMPVNSVVGECCLRRGLEVMPVHLKELPCENNQFDIVIARNVLHLVKEPKSLLDEFYRVLRPGGKLVASVPNFRNIKTIKNWIINANYKGTINRKNIGAEPFTRKTINMLVKSRGFRNPNFYDSIPERLIKINSLSLGILSQKLSPSIYLLGEK